MTEGIEPNLRQSARGLWPEIGVVLLVCIVPNLFNAIAYRVMSPSASGGFTYNFTYRSLALIIQSIGSIVLVSFLISRSGEGAGKFGIFRIRGYDLAGMIGVYVAMHIGNYALWYGLIATLGRSRVNVLMQYDLSSITGPSSGFDFALLSIMSLINGIAEELVCRSYLITRFEKVLGSTTLAVLLSSILFGSYHIYQGTGGMISAIGVGLTFGVIFVLFRRFWPLALGHAIQDLIAIAMMAK